MNRKVRKSVFETNSSTSHTLTIQRIIDDNDIGKYFDGSMIPSNTTFEFCNSMVENIEDLAVDCKEKGKEYLDTFIFYKEIDKLALCVSLCFNLYDNEQQKTSGHYFWDYSDEIDEENGGTLNDVVKDKPFFKDLIQAVKEERNTDLVFVDGLYELDSLNDDDAFVTLFKSYHETVSKNEDLVQFFKDVIFGSYTIKDDLFPM